MSLCSCPSCSTISSSLKQSESSNSYRLLSSSSITTVSSQLDNERRGFITDDEQWPNPPMEADILQSHIVHDNWRIEKNISLKDQQSNKNSCILKATMTKEQILICDSTALSTRIIRGKHVSMKVVFNF